jgi:putative transcription factor
LNCDICGEEFYSRSTKIAIEGAVLDVCSRCAHLGKPYVPPTDDTRPHFLTRESVTARPSVGRTSILPRTYEELDLIDGFGKKIRDSREGLGISQAELATRVKERLSIIQKIETEKITPNTNLCRSLEHVLRIKLLAPRKEMPVSTTSIAKPSEVTLGDIVKLKRKN